MDYQGQYPAPTVLCFNVTAHNAQLFALPPVAYVREIIFIDPETPRANMMSQNLNLAQYVYVPEPC